MIQKSLSILLLALTLYSCNQQPKQPTINKTITVGETTPIIDKWLDLWETYDLALLDSIFYKSDSLTYFSSEKEGLIKGYEKMKPHHEGFGFVQGGKQAEKSLWLEDLDTKLYGETAMVSAIWYFGDKSIPKDSVQNGPVTFILKKDTELNVRIIHTHFANY